MSKYKNFLLMLKQGIKGVFQFKAQFIIIIILAFVATFILSISVSTQRNLKSSYDRIVKSYPKFDYQGNIQTQSDANSNSDPFLLASELDNSTPTSFTVNDENVNKNNGVSSSTSSYNFVLYNGPKNDWYKDYQGKNVDTFLTEATSKFINDKKVSTADANYFQTLNFYYVKELFSELDKISKTGSLETMTKYSPIAIFTKQNPNWYDKFRKSDFKDASNLDDYFDLTSKTEAIPHRDILNNVLRGIASICGFLQTQYANYNNSTIGENAKIDNAEKLNAFLFGTGIAAGTNKWVVDDTNKAYTTNLKIDANDKDENDKVLARFNSTWDGNNDGAIWYSGLRGITNPFIDGNTTKGGTPLTSKTYDRVSNWDKFDRMTINSGTDSMYNNMDNVEHDFYKTDLTSLDLNDWANGGQASTDDDDTLFRVQNELAAADAGFDFKLRREATYFDSNSQYKFRAVVLNSHENYNFTILSGRFPNTGEVAISEQFARKNKLKVGSAIVVGDAQVLISALATDALSYLPSQDIDDPIPNPAVSSFLYTDSATIKRIWSGTKGSTGNTNAVTQNTAYFLFSNGNANVKGTTEQRKNAYLALYANSKNGALNNTILARQFVDNGVVNGVASSNLSYKKFGESPYRYSNSLQPLVFEVYDAVTYVAAAIIAIITIASVIVCVKKTIDLNSKQIGILKALGEQPGGISVNYISYAMVLGIIVVPLAWIIGNVLQIPFSSMFLTYFSVQPDVIDFDWISFVIAFGVLGIGTGVISFLSAYFLTKQPVLKILTSSVKWGKLWILDELKKKLFSRAPFSTRFSLTLTSSGSRQIILMTVVVLVASFLMSLVLAIPSVMVKVENSYYKSAKYANKYDQIPMTGNAPLSKNAISYWNGHDYLDNDYVDGKLQLDASDARYGYYKDIQSYTSTNSDASTWPEFMYDINADKSAVPAANNNAIKTDATNTPNNGITVFDSYVLGHIQQLLSVIGNTMGANYGTHLGVSFSVGMIDQIYGLLLHGLDDQTTMATPNMPYTDQKKFNEAQNLSGWLTSSVPKIIGAIVGSFSGGGNTGASQTTQTETWKQKVMDAIYAVVPSYVKGYVQRSDSRLDQFGISFDNEMYIPGQETFTTTVDKASKSNANNSSMQLTGLDKYQNSLIVKDKDKDKVYLTQKDINNVMNVINVPVNGDKPIHDITMQNDPSFKLYDASTNTFNLPILPNEQAASYYKLSKGNQMNGWDNATQLIQMQSANGSWFNLPKTAWAYDDTDYASYLKNNTDDTLATQFNNKVPYANDPNYDPSDPNGNWEYDSSVNGKYYLEPSMLNNNKLTFSKEFSNYDYDDNNNVSETVNLPDGTKAPALADRAQFFKNFKYDKDGKPTGTYLRPYYQYKNFKLMVPSNWVNTDDLLYSGYSAAKTTKLGDGGFPDMPDFKTWKDEAKQWFNTSVDDKDIPQSVKDGYERIYKSNPKVASADPNSSDTKWTVISPYDWTYKDKDFTLPDPLTNLVTGSPYWYRYAFLSGNAGGNQYNSIMRLDNNVSVRDMIEDTQAGFTSKKPNINLVSVGTIDSYNDKVIVCDSDLANILLGYSTKRNYQYNSQMFDKSSVVKAGEKAADGSVSRFDRYSLVDTTAPSFLEDDWATNPSAKANDMWQLSWQPYIDAIGGNKNIENYAPHLFYNGVLSNIDEPVEYTSQYSETVPMRIGQEAIGLSQGLGSGETSMIRTSTLLSTTKHLIQQLALLAIAIVAMLMVAIIITAALLIMLTGDIYIEQYKRFMVLLRALGYSKVQIFVYTFAPVSIFSLLAWAAGTIVAWVIVYVAVNSLWAAGLAIPMGITWWPIIISFVVMFISYAGSLWVSSGKARKAAPSEVLSATAE